MQRPVITPLGTLQNEISYTNNLNNNLNELADFIELSLSRFDDSNNQIESDVDFNSHKILNAGCIQTDDLIIGTYDFRSMFDSIVDQGNRIKLLENSASTLTAIDTLQILNNQISEIDYSLLPQA